MICLKQNEHEHTLVQGEGTGVQLQTIMNRARYIEEVIK